MLYKGGGVGGWKPAQCSAWCKVLYHPCAMAKSTDTQWVLWNRDFACNLSCQVWTV